MPGGEKEEPGEASQQFFAMPTIAICEDDLATSRYIEGLVRAYQKQRPGQIDQVAVYLSSGQLLEETAEKG